MCDHGFIGACSECDGSGQVPEVFDEAAERDEDVWPDPAYTVTKKSYLDPYARQIER